MQGCVEGLETRLALFNKAAYTFLCKDNLQGNCETIVHEMSNNLKMPLVDL